MCFIGRWRRGEIFSTDVVRAVFRNFKEERKSGPAIPHNESGWFGLPKAADLVFRVPGRSDAGSAAASARHRPRYAGEVRAPKGGAVPGERIVGVREEDSIVIYPIHSPALTEFDDRPELWLDVRWDLENAPTALYSTQIVVTLLNEPGALGVIAATIPGNMAQISDSVATSPSGADFRRFVIDLQVRDIQHLNAVLSQQIRDKSVVHNVRATERIGDADAALFRLWLQYGRRRHGSPLSTLEGARSCPAKGGIGSPLCARAG